MSEVILNTSALPDPLPHMIKTPRVKVTESGRDICLTPIDDADTECPLLGLCVDSDLTVEKMLAMKRADKELEA
jgi:hypothetical protein